MVDRESLHVLYECERHNCRGTSYIEAYCPHCGWHRTDRVRAKVPNPPKATSKWRCGSCLSESIVRHWCIHCGVMMSPVNDYRSFLKAAKNAKVKFSDPSLSSGAPWFKRTIFGVEECAWCERKSDLTVHHFIPRGKGGTDAATNRLVLCRSHHELIHITRVNDKDGFSARVHEMLKKHKLRLPPNEVESA